MKSKLLLAINYIVIGLLLVYYGLFLAQKVDLTTADLGRHIENGRLIIHGSNTERQGVLYTNFYSYSMPDQPFVNHHWLSGVVFYLIYLASGFKGLSLFYILLGCVTLFLFFDVARKKSNLFIATVVSIALMPLIASRAEVRPEMFTYFFTGVFLWCLSRGYTDSADGTDKIISHPTPSLSAEGGHLPQRGRNMWLLPAAMLLWVNLHIGFVFGFLVLGAFCIEQYIITLSRIWREWPLLAAERGRTFGSNLSLALSKHWRGKIKSLTLSSILCVAAALINPNFLKGFLYPLNIFKNYGYLIVENQSIKFLENLKFTAGQHFLLFKVVVVVIVISYIAAFIVNRRKISIALFLLTVTSGFLAYNGIRHFPSFAFFAIVSIAANLGVVIERLRGTTGLKYKVIKMIFAPTGLFLGIIFAWQGYQTLQARGAALGLGLLPRVNTSVEFFKAQNIRGPIFNDYDIGGYLIFNLYPQKVFVDNRPEAYTKDFFENIYKPMQEKEQDWRAMDEKYNFNSIFFSHRDYTPWAQAFLISRVQDPDWAPVFVDGYNIIFLKRNEQNKPVIQKFEIPKERFGISTN